MPIKIPDHLPARSILEQEGVMVMDDWQAARQDIRPLRIAVLNLMPLKVPTETQLARVLGASPLQVEVTLITTESYVPKNTSAEHMAAFYKPWSEVRSERFDGLIVTGAPVELLPFEAVKYWPELREILDWARTNVFQCFFICWGAQAALYHYFQVPKYELPGKAFGIYTHQIVSPGHRLLRGFDDDVPVPVSRHTEVRRVDIAQCPSLEILLESRETGVCLVRDRQSGDMFMLNHLEYDWCTLRDEYERDVQAGKPIAMPANYFPNNDPGLAPRNRWRSHSFLMFGNWLNDVYQGTPYDLGELEQAKATYRSLAA
jgi:homoserine O-succinyltransferase/O-acetyltransferase